MDTLISPPPMKAPPAVAGQHQRTRRNNRRANVTWTVFARFRGQRLRFHTVDVSARGAKLIVAAPVFGNLRLGLGHR